MMTPTPDAWTMLALAMPMVGLFYSAVGVATLLDRRRARQEPEWTHLADEEASSLDEQPSPLDEPASSLDEEAAPLDKGAGPL